MSYNKYKNRNNELEPDVSLEYVEPLCIDSYGIYEDLTFENTFGVEQAFYCEDYN